MDYRRMGADMCGGPYNIPPRHFSVTSVKMQQKLNVWIKSKKKYKDMY